MDDPLAPELALIAALKLTFPPPRWVQAAALIPSTLQGLERLLSEPGFRSEFAADEAQALRRAGLEDTPALREAVRSRLS